MAVLTFKALSAVFSLSVINALWTTAFFLIGILSGYFSLRILAREFRGENACAACPLRKKCEKSKAY